MRYICYFYDLQAKRFTVISRPHAIAGDSGIYKANNMQ